MATFGKHSPETRSSLISIKSRNTPNKLKDSQGKCVSLERLHILQSNFLEGIHKGHLEAEYIALSQHNITAIGLRLLELRGIFCFSYPF
jgi:hypothetical protein